jgi:hypothetical protein
LILRIILPDVLAHEELVHVEVHEALHRVSRVSGVNTFVCFTHEFGKFAVHLVLPFYIVKDQLSVYSLGFVFGR